MRRRIVSLWFPLLTIDRLRRRRRQDWRDRPLAVIAESGNRVFLSAVDAAAEQAGLAAGMTLADARAIAPSLLALPAQPRAEHLFLKGLARWCARFTPLVALDPPDGLVLDITGCGRLFGGEEAILSTLIEGLCGHGLAVRGALAHSAAAAQALARFAANGASVPAEGTRAALAPLPVQALRLEPPVAATLMRLGLERVGDLYGIEQAALRRRFGVRTVRRLRQALGAEAESLRFLRPRPRFAVALAFAEPVGGGEQIAQAAARLVEKLCARLRRRAMGCRRLVLTLHRVDGSAWSLSIGSARPVQAPRLLMQLLGERLGEADPGFGIERMEAEAARAEPVTADERPLLQSADGTQPARGEAAEALLDRLINRLGFERVLAFAPAASHVPERAYSVRSAPFREDAGAWPGHPARPLRLLARPEPLYGFTLRGFRWAGEERRIARALGPERIEPEWWWDDADWRAGGRDYWLIEDEQGHRFWIYATACGETGGRHASGTRAARTHPSARWYLHGLFA